MKKTISILLALVLCVGILAGCGSKKAEDKTITVAASPTPHAEILKVAADVLAKDGWTLQVTEYADYVVPNNVVEDGEMDANYFQHQPYLDTFNKENGTTMSPSASTRAPSPPLPTWLTATRSPFPTTAPTVPVPCCCWRPTASSS